MSNAWSGLVTAVGIWAILFSVVPSEALIVLWRDTTDIGKIVIVSPQSGDSAIANGTALINAINNITDASSADPYVLKLGPGIYDVQGTSIQMKEYVDIEGSGEKTTKITGAISSSSNPPTSGTLLGANNAEIRALAVESIGTGTFIVAILNSSASPSITHVTATASGGENSYSVYNDSSSPNMTNVTAAASGETNNYGIYNYFSSPKMTDVTATASGGAYNYGVYNDSSSPKMTDVTATASGGTNNRGVSNFISAPIMTDVTVTASGGTNNYGIYNFSPSGMVKINHSVIKGTTNTIYNGTGVTTFVGNSQLDGGAISNTGTLTCVGAYDGTYVALSTTCQ